MIVAEVSGFMGWYEIACQLMILQGLAWFEQNPNADPKFHGYEGVTGILAEDNADAKALSEAVLRDVPGGPSGAMHHYTVLHVLRIQKSGREKYLSEAPKLLDIPFETAEQMRAWLNDPANHREYDHAQQWTRVKGEVVA